MDPEDWKRDDKPKSFYNPLKVPFLEEYRDEDNKVRTIVIQPLTIETYPTYLANTIIEDLVTALINERELGFITPEEREKLRKEVEVGS